MLPYRAHNYDLGMTVPAEVANLGVVATGMVL